MTVATGTRPRRVRYPDVVRDVLLDALNEATPVYWRRRAATFAAVGTPGCDETALACERHADLLAADPADVSELVDLVLAEQAAERAT